MVRDEYLSNQLIKLGDMMGDGLHHEPGGKWISKEYSKIVRILMPEIRQHDKTSRVEKNKRIDIQIAKLLEDRKCKCGGAMSQSRSGSRVVYCDSCKSRYIARNKK